MDAQQLPAAMSAGLQELPAFPELRPWTLGDFNEVVRKAKVSKKAGLDGWHNSDITLWPTWLPGWVVYLLNLVEALG